MTSLFWIVISLAFSSGQTESKIENLDQYPRLARHHETIVKIVNDSLKKHYFFEDNGQSCSVTEKDLWGYKILDITDEQGVLLSVVIHLYTSPPARYCGGSGHIEECYIELTRTGETNPFSEHYTECQAITD